MRHARHYVSRQNNAVQYAFDELSLPASFCRNFASHSGATCQVYPIGIPVLYAAILWKNRELLNPRIDSQPVGEDGHAKHKLSPQELQELDEKVEARRANPALVPSMFLWKDFGKSFKANFLPGACRNTIAHRWYTLCVWFKVVGSLFYQV